MVTLSHSNIVRLWDAISAKQNINSGYWYGQFSLLSFVANMPDVNVPAHGDPNIFQLEKHCPDGESVIHNAKALQRCQMSMETFRHAG